MVRIAITIENLGKRGKDCDDIKAKSISKHLIEGVEHMRRLFSILLTLAVVLTVHWSVQGQSLDRERILSQPLKLQPDTTYEISLKMRGNEPNAVVTLSIEFYGRTGERLGYWRTYRGLGENNRWQTLGLEVETPKDDNFTAQLVISASQSGQYFWEDLEIVRLDKSFEGVRTFWETKFATYGAVHTGLVVDARGMNVERGMSPRIYSESGQLIYAGDTASMDFIQRRGIVSYGSELDANLYTRIQADPSYPYALPLTVHIVDVAEGPLRTSVIISDQDAEAILDAIEAYDFLARFAVVFLID